MLSTNGNLTTGVEHGINAQFLKLMSVVFDSGDDVWIVAAANRPWALSAAMSRRFSEKIYVSLPEKRDALNLVKETSKNPEPAREGRRSP